MDGLNYQHLYYFWTVVREGTVQAAARRLRLSQPGISAQLKLLEEQANAKLFVRAGRTKRLTELGVTVFRYADEIFAVGRELQEAVRLHTTGRPRLRVGVADVLPKIFCAQVLAPLQTGKETVWLECYEGKPPDLLARLSLHELDVVLTDMPVSSSENVKAFSHLLGESSVSVLGAQSLASRYRPHFPQSLAEAPLLLPTRNTRLRRLLDEWFDAQGIQPQVRGEFEDSALLKAFAERGAGLCLAPKVISAAARRQYSLALVGHLDDIREQFYAISLERRVSNPVVTVIVERAKRGVFGA